MLRSLDEASTPADFGDLIRRLAAPAAPTAEPVRPFVASAVELDCVPNDEQPASEERLWVVVHTITNSEMQLIHSRPIRSKKLVLRIDSPSGEIVKVVLHAKNTSIQGDLFETTAQFYR